MALLPVNLKLQKSITPSSMGAKQIGIEIKRARYPVYPFWMNARDRTKKKPANISPGSR
jgi:hypothetical protein